MSANEEEFFNYLENQFYDDHEGSAFLGAIVAVGFSALGVASVYEVYDQAGGKGLIAASAVAITGIALALRKREHNTLH